MSLTDITFCNNTYKALEKPFIIHWTPENTNKRYEKAGKSKRVSIRLTRKTFAVNFTTDGMIMLSVARCSKRDAFSRRIGRQVALGRLNSMLRENEHKTPEQVEMPDFAIIENYKVFINMTVKQNVKYMFDCTIPADVIEYIQVLQARFMESVNPVQPIGTPV